MNSEKDYIEENSIPRGLVMLDQEIESLVRDRDPA
jgi:hypothetical protein